MELDEYCINGFCKDDLDFQRHFSEQTVATSTRIHSRKLLSDEEFDSALERLFIEAQDTETDAQLSREVGADDSDVSSLASFEESSSMTSGTSLTSQSLGSDTSNVIKELVSVLLRYPGLLRLLTDGAHRLPFDRLERNISRLLRDYGEDLKSEEYALLEREASHFVRIKARLISHMLLSGFDPRNSTKFETLRELSKKDHMRQEKVERYIEQQTRDKEITDPSWTQMPAFLPHLADIDLDGFSSDEGDDENWSRLRNIHLVTDFMTKSKAFLKFHKNLELFIHPTPRTKTKPGTKIGTPTILSVPPLKSNVESSVERVLEMFEPMLSPRLAPLITTLIRDVTRPRVPPGYRRITWTCVSVLGSIYPLWQINKILYRAAEKQCLRTYKILSSQKPQGLRQSYGNAHLKLMRYYGVDLRVGLASLLVHTMIRRAQQAPVPAHLHSRQVLLHLRPLHQRWQRGQHGRAMGRVQTNVKSATKVATYCFVSTEVVRLSLNS